MSSTNTFDWMKKGVRAADRARARRDNLQQLRELEEKSIRDRGYYRMPEPEFGYDHWQSGNVREHGARDHEFRGSSAYDFEEEAGERGSVTMERERRWVEEERMRQGYGPRVEANGRRGTGKPEWEARMERRIAEEYEDQRKHLGDRSGSRAAHDDHEGTRMEKYLSGLCPEVPASPRQDFHSPGREDREAHYPRDYVPSSTLATFGSLSNTSSRSYGSSTHSRDSDITVRQPDYWRSPSEFWDPSDYSESRGSSSTKSKRRSRSHRHRSHDKSEAAKNCVEINIRVPQTVQKEERKPESRQMPRPKDSDYASEFSKDLSQSFRSRKEGDGKDGRALGIGSMPRHHRDMSHHEYDLVGGRGNESSQVSARTSTLDRHSLMEGATRYSDQTYHTAKQDHPGSMETTRGSLAPVLSERTPDIYQQQARNHSRYGRYMGDGQAGEAVPQLHGPSPRGYPSPAYRTHRERIRAANYLKALGYFAGR